MSRDAKLAAVEQWTADPCEERWGEGPPGTAAYFSSIVAARRDACPWMDDVLDYQGAAGRDVLDVGCGQGIDLFRYTTAGARATGIDLTPRHVELARAHLNAMGAKATVALGDAEALPFADASFDRVSSNGVLHHTPDFGAALHEIHRVLRPGGEAHIVVYNRDSLHYWLQQVVWNGLLRGELFREGSMLTVLSKNVEYSRVDARPLVRVHSRRQLRAAMTGAGFSDVLIAVRHFRLQDTPFTQPLTRFGRLRDAAVLDWIGRRVGWYVAAMGRRR